MADERDPKVSRRYRELGNEEPPPGLDESIVSAARRAAEHPHAPLVTPSGRHRWYFSLGAAAVIVLAVAVTYQMQQEQPDPFATGVSREAVKSPANGRAREPAPPAADSSATARPEAATQAETSGRQGAAAPEARMRRDEAAARSLAKPMQAPVVETPERMLERIVELRQQGKNEEAERLLAELRRRYPDYRIPENVVRP